VSVFYVVEGHVTPLALAFGVRSSSSRAVFDWERSHRHLPPAATFPARRRANGGGSGSSMEAAAARDFIIAECAQGKRGE
jgi:hypothetical protein